ncbi:MAG: hypothetical protein AAF702_10210 [Chloroflexota bacterium]
MGVIDSLSAGYRYITERLYLLIIPVLLDLLLWRLPRLSLSSIFERLAVFYLEAAQVDGLSAELKTVTEQLAEMLKEIGHQANLWNLLVSDSLLHVPSVMVLVEPLAPTELVELSDPFTVVSLMAFLLLAGFFIGVVYLGLLAKRLPIGEGEKNVDWPLFLINSGKRWLHVVLFVIAIIIGFLVLMIPISIGVTVLALISPGLASGITILLSGLIFVLFFYLYFVTAGLVMDDLTVFQAVSRSLRVVRNYFWSVFGFVLLINVISGGLGTVFRQIATYTPAGTLAAILLNAYVGSGLAMALLVFYRTRVLILDEKVTLDQIIDQS